MRIAFISNCHAVDRYLIREVAREHQVVGILRPGAPAGRPKRRAAKPSIGVRLARVAQQRVYDVYYARMNHRVGESLYGGEEPGLPVTPTDIPRDRLHDAPALSLVEGWHADVLVVSGAPILRPALYELAPIAVNVHLGMAPDYRGEHTLFMPLLRGDYDRIGATLHRIDAGVDTGAVLARVFPELEPRDDETTLLIKSLQMIAKALVDFVKATDTGRADQHSGGFPAVRETGLFGTPAGGFNIKYRDRSLRHDLVFQARRALGFGPLPRAPRVEVFY